MGWRPFAVGGRLTPRSLTVQRGFAGRGAHGPGHWRLPCWRVRRPAARWCATRSASPTCCWPRSALRTLIATRLSRQDAARLATPPSPGDQAEGRACAGQSGGAPHTQPGLRRVDAGVRRFSAGFAAVHHRGPTLIWHYPVALRAFPRSRSAARAAGRKDISSARVGWRPLREPWPGPRRCHALPGTPTRNRSLFERTRFTLIELLVAIAILGLVAVLELAPGWTAWCARRPRRASAASNC